MSDQYVGEIRLFAGNYAPEGWVLCDGRLLAISTYSTLYALLGTTYGGDGVSTFAVPDLRGRISVGQGTSTTGISYIRGQRFGAETVTLDSSAIPSHSHTVTGTDVTTNATNTPTAGTSIFCNNTGTIGTYLTKTSTTPTATLGDTALSPSGAAVPHDNMMPFIVLNYIIATEGYFPQQA